MSMIFISEENAVLTKKEFKQSESATYSAIEISNTLGKYLKRIFDTKTPWTEREIKNVKKAIGFCSSLSKEEQAILVSHLNYALEHNEKAYRITKEQDLKGKNYLLQNSLKLDGELRKTNILGSREIRIMKSLKHHEFLGFRNVSRNAYPEYVPLYRAISKKGESFIYTGIRYQFIEVL